MKILVDLKHPADVHFFRHVVRRLRQDGHEVTTVCRDTPIVRELLDHEGAPYTPLGPRGRGALGLGWEQLRRDWRLWRLARRIRPDVMVAKNGIAVGHVGALLRIPSLSFEDAEHARMQIRLSRPFVTHILTEDCFLESAGPKHERYASLNPLAYLHPRQFQPDPDALAPLGLAPGQPYVVVRFIAWDALHDARVARASEEERRWMIDELARLARVVIVPEGTLAADLRRFAPPLPAHRFHDVLALSAAHVGEGGSTAAEAAVLGVPSVYMNRLGVGYIRELSRYGLCRWETEPEAAVALVRGWLADAAGTRAKFAAARNRLLAEKEDLVEWVARRIVAAGGAA